MLIYGASIIGALSIYIRIIAINKYLIIFISWIISVISISGLSYYKGKMNERNSIENQQKILIISEQKSLLHKQQQIIKLNDSHLSGYSGQLNLQHESYLAINRKLQDEKMDLDRSNRITAKFVRLYNSAIRANDLSKTNASASTVIAESATIAASTTLEIINNNTQKCNGYILQLNHLIDYIYKYDEINK